MKKLRSPLADRSQATLLTYNKSNRLPKQQAPLGRMVTEFKRQHENEHKRSSNSIKKVLNQLSSLRRQLRQIKTTNKSQLEPSQGLDMSTCRKIQAEVRKSLSPESNTRIKSNSNSKNSSNSYRKQISNKTKGKIKDVPQFSFSIDSKIQTSKHKNKQKLQPKQSEQEDDESERNHHLTINKASSSVLSKKEDYKISAQSSPKKPHLHDRVATIQANQQHQRRTNTLKTHLEVIQVTSPSFSVDQRLKLNIELERMSNHLSRIPAYTIHSEQYYQNMQIYTRNLNNQFNNLALILNRCESNVGWLKEKKRNNEEGKKNSLEEVTCKNCIENERMGLQRGYKKDIKKMNRSIKLCEQQLSLKAEQLDQVHVKNNILSYDNDKLKEEIKQLSKRQRQTHEENKILQQQLERCNCIMQQLSQSKQNLTNRARNMEQDLRYYRQEIQNIRNHKYGHAQNDRQDTNSQNRVKDLQMIIKELKEKQLLYQSVIKEKDSLLQDRKSSNSFHHPKTLNYKQQKHSEQSIDSAEFYKQKVELEERNKQIEDYIAELAALKKQIQQLSLVNRQTNNSLDLCLMEINKLHAQIDDLETANQKYKDKNLKNRIINQRKSKKQAESSNRKGKALEQINDLIKHHREVALKDTR